MTSPSFSSSGLGTHFREVPLRNALAGQSTLISTPERSDDTHVLPVLRYRRGLDVNRSGENKESRPGPFDSPIFQLHVLVTEPNKPQRHLVIGELASGAAAAVVEKDEILQPGKLFRLDDSESGRVELVPRQQH